MKNIKILFRVIVSILSFVLLAPYALADYWWGMMRWEFFSWGWFIAMIVFWWAIIYFIVLASKFVSNQDEKEIPLEILKKRLAKWEITEEEFEKLKKKIQIK